MQNFIDETEPISKKIELNNSQILMLEKLRDTLLPKLMSGDIRVDYEGAPSETKAA